MGTSQISSTCRAFAPCLAGENWTTNKPIKVLIVYVSLLFKGCGVYGLGLGPGPGPGPRPGARAHTRGSVVSTFS